MAAKYIDEHSRNYVGAFIFALSNGIKLGREETDRVDWLRKLLEEQGVPADKIQGIVDATEKQLQESHVPKSKHDEVSESIKQLQKDIKERDKQLGDLKKSVGDNEELNKQIEQLQKDNKAATEKYEADMKTIRTVTAVKHSLAGKVHENALESILKEIDLSKVELDENHGIKSGYEEQEKALRENKGFYFLPDEGTKTTFSGLTPPEGSGSQIGGADALKSIVEQNILGGY